LFPASAPKTIISAPPPQGREFLPVGCCALRATHGKAVPSSPPQLLATHDDCLHVATIAGKGFQKICFGWQDSVSSLFELQSQLKRGAKQKKVQTNLPVLGITNRESYFYLPELRSI
jgi:hypothetical protein